MRGLYVHIPFCVSKCTYCDFYSLPAQIEFIYPYIEAVLREGGIHTGLSFHTLYLGGGTPSLLGARGLRNLLDGLCQAFNLSGLVEATMEVNPESTTLALLETARDMGINRVSIGVQSLSDYELGRVGRIHTAAQAIKAVEQAKKVGFSTTSADVIIGLPGQKGKTLSKTLEVLGGLGIEHLSLYCLSLEPGAPLSLNPPDDLPSDDRQAKLFHQASSFLNRHGFAHYEISNFALQGHECLHNINYWRGGEYLGLGPSAASHLYSRRFKNRADFDAYLNDPTDLMEEVEELGRKEKAAEEAMLRLRLLLEGLDISRLTRRFGYENVEAIVSSLDKMVEEGLLNRDGSSYRLAPSRVLTSNPIFARVLRDC